MSTLDLSPRPGAAPRGAMLRAQTLMELRLQTRRLFTEVDVLALPTVPTTFTLEQIAEEPLRRNAILGRASTPEEIAFLQEPGSRF